MTIELYFTLLEILLLTRQKLHEYRNRLIVLEVKKLKRKIYPFFVA